MKKDYKDTIVAISTPPGKGGIGIIRISGPSVKKISKEIFKKSLQPRKAEYLQFFKKNGACIDYGIALFFQKPNSFTGEDVLELHGHGNPIVLNVLIDQILLFPYVRMARPGEFSERAFLNNKLDLTQAEAISDLINANSSYAASLALNTLQGKFSEYINKIINKLINLRSSIEGYINFPDEKIDFFLEENLKKSLKNIKKKISEIRNIANQNNINFEGLKIVIVGEPNVGKSSIMNALTNREISITSSISGTTRDVLQSSINLEGIVYYITDTAGLHETDNPIEKIGIQKAWKEIKDAHHILLVIDGSEKNFHKKIKYFSSLLQNRIKKNTKVTILLNKIDLVKSTSLLYKHKESFIPVSATAKINIQKIKDHLVTINRKNDTHDEVKFLVKHHHLQMLKYAGLHIKNSLKFLQNDNIELLAEEIRLSQESLSEITGKVTTDKLLEKIFSNFCIGK